jgi:hypothetical protein
VGECEIVEVDRCAGERVGFRADNDKPGSPPAQRLGQPAHQDVGREMVDHKHPRHPVGRAAIQWRDERRVADHDIRQGCLGEAVGELSHLVEPGEIGPFEREIRVRYRCDDPVAG